MQHDPPLIQPEAIPCSPAATYMGEETDPQLTTASCQAVVESDNISPEPHPDWTIPAPSAAPHKTCAPDPSQFCCPSVDIFQVFNVFLVVRGPKLNTELKVQPHQCWVQRDDHLPAHTGNTISDTNQDATGFLGHLGTLLAHVQPSIDQHAQVHFFHTVFQPLCPKPVALPGVNCSWYVQPQPKYFIWFLSFLRTKKSNYTKSEISGQGRARFLLT